MSLRSAGAALLWALPLLAACSPAGESGVPADAAPGTDRSSPPREDAFQRPDAAAPDAAAPGDAIGEADARADAWADAGPPTDAGSLLPDLGPPPADEVPFQTGFAVGVAPLRSARYRLVGVAGPVAAAGPRLESGRYHLHSGPLVWIAGGQPPGGRALTGRQEPGGRPPENTP